MALRRSGFKLELRPISSLRAHEDTIPSHVAELAKLCERDGAQKDPLLLDSRTSTVVDGMHRLAAFKLLGLRKVVCCSFDYGSESVSVYRWARSYSGRGVQTLVEVAKKAGTTREASPKDALSELEYRGPGLAVMSSEGALLPKECIGLAGGFAVVRALDAAAETEGLTRRFVAESELEVELARRDTVVALVERLSKADVVEAAKTGDLFPCKTSMHVIDPRPVAVNFPLRDLNSATEARVMDLDLESRGSLTPPGTVYEGRRYKERLLLLNSE